MSFKKRLASNADGESIRTLVYAVLKEYGLPPDPHGMDADLQDIESHYLQRGGAFWVVVEEEEKIVGCVGLYPEEDAPTTEGVVELRKMYLAPEARGLGLGKELLTTAVEEARRSGFRRIELNTASPLQTAIRLYRRFGFQEIPCNIIGKRCDQAFALDL